jgi:hypothetical protein
MNEIKVRISYDIVTEESAKNGDISESGWIEEEGKNIGSVQEVVDFLESEGAVFPSTTIFHTGLWYHTEAYQDMYSGDWETRYYFLKHASDTEQLEIFKMMTSD